MSQVNDVSPEGRIRLGISLIEKWKRMGTVVEDGENKYSLVSLIGVNTIEADLRKVIDDMIVIHTHTIDIPKNEMHPVICRKCERSKTLIELKQKIFGLEDVPSEASVRRS